MANLQEGFRDRWEEMKMNSERELNRLFCLEQELRGLLVNHDKLEKKHSKMLSLYELEKEIKVCHIKKLDIEFQELGQKHKLRTIQTATCKAEVNRCETEVKKSINDLKAAKKEKKKLQADMEFFTLIKAKSKILEKMHNYLKDITLYSNENPITSSVDICKSNGDKMVAWKTKSKEDKFEYYKEMLSKNKQIVSEALELLRQMTFVKEDLMNNKIDSDINNCKEKLSRLQKKEKKCKLRNIKEYSKELYETIKWFRSRRSADENVYEPLMSLINFTDPKYARCLENLIEEEKLTVFSVESVEQGDWLSFLNELNEFKAKTYVNSESSRLDVLCIPSEATTEPKHSIEEYGDLGLQTYLIDTIIAPEPIKRMLCKEFDVHNIPIGDDVTYKKRKQVFKTFDKFFTENHFCQTMKTTKKVRHKVEDLKPAKLLAGTGYYEKIELCKQELKQHKKKCTTYKKDVQQYKKKILKIEDLLKLFAGIEKDENKVPKDTKIKKEMMEESALTIEKLESDFKKLVNKLQCPSLYALDDDKELLEIEAQLDSSKVNVTFTESEQLRLSSKFINIKNQLRKAEERLMQERSDMNAKLEELKKSCNNELPNTAEFSYKGVFEMLPNNLTDLESLETNLHIRLSRIERLTNEEKEIYEVQKRRIIDLKAEIRSLTLRKYGTEYFVWKLKKIEFSDRNINSVKLDYEKHPEDPRRNSRYKIHRAYIPPYTPSPPHFLSPNSSPSSEDAISSAWLMKKQENSFNKAEENSSYTHRYKELYIDSPRLVKRKADNVDHGAMFSKSSEPVNALKYESAKRSRMEETESRSTSIFLTPPHVHNYVNMSLPPQSDGPNYFRSDNFVFHIINGASLSAPNGERSNDAEICKDVLAKIRVKTEKENCYTENHTLPLKCSNTSLEINEKDYLANSFQEMKVDFSYMPQNMLASASLTGLQTENLTDSAQWSSKDVESISSFLPIDTKTINLTSRIPLIGNNNFRPEKSDEFNTCSEDNPTLSPLPLPTSYPIVPFQPFIQPLSTIAMAPSVPFLLQPPQVTVDQPEQLNPITENLNSELECLPVLDTMATASVTETPSQPTTPNSQTLTSVKKSVLNLILKNYEPKQEKVEVSDVIDLTADDFIDLPSDKESKESDTNIDTTAPSAVKSCYTPLSSNPNLSSDVKDFTSHNLIYSDIESDESDSYMDTTAPSARQNCYLPSIPTSKIKISCNSMTRASCILPSHNSSLESESFKSEHLKGEEKQNTSLQKTILPPSILQTMPEAKCMQKYDEVPQTLSDVTQLKMDEDLSHQGPMPGQPALSVGTQEFSSNLLISLVKEINMKLKQTENVTSFLKDAEEEEIEKKNRREKAMKRMKKLKRRLRKYNEVSEVMKTLTKAFIKNQIRK